MVYAYPDSIDGDLPQIVDLIRQVLAGESSGWKRALRYLPENRNSRTALAVGAMVAVAALIVGWSMRPARSANPFAAALGSYANALESPMGGRWQGTRAKEIRLAQLEWSGPGCGSFRETNAVLPPCTGRETTGIKWRIVSELNEQTWVSGLSR